MSTRLMRMMTRRLVITLPAAATPLRRLNYVADTTTAAYYSGYHHHHHRYKTTTTCKNGTRTTRTITSSRTRHYSSSSSSSSPQIPKEEAAVEEEAAAAATTTGQRVPPSASATSSIITSPQTSSSSLPPAVPLHHSPIDTRITFMRKDSEILVQEQQPSVCATTDKNKSHHRSNANNRTLPLTRDQATSIITDLLFAISSSSSSSSPLLRGHEGITLLRRRHRALPSSTSSSSSPVVVSPSSSTSSLHPLTIEFSSPNIAKPLHMGHLRSTITGSFVRNVAEMAGHPCTSLCFLGDWGRQFGVLQAGLLLNNNSDDASSTNNESLPDLLKSLTLQELLNVYVAASARVEKDPEFRAEALRCSAELEKAFDEGNANSSSSASTSHPGKILWTHTRNLTLEHLHSTYASLSVRFDAFEGESEFRCGSQHTNAALQLIRDKNLLVECPDGSVRVNVKTTATTDTSHIILKKDGSTVYLLRDIACAIKRFQERKNTKRENGYKAANISPDHVHANHRFVYVVDQSQSSHFRNLFSILNSLGLDEREVNEEMEHHQKSPITIISSTPFPSRFTFVPFGRVTGMSTRSGTATLLSDVISEGTSLMHSTRRTSKNARNTDDLVISEQLAVSGLIVNALKSRRLKSYSFDWAEALRTSGNTGVALQYTVARLRSLVKRIGGDGKRTPAAADKSEFVHVLLHSGKSEILDLIVAVINFEDTFWRSYLTLEPCVLVSYLFHLSDKISRALATVNLLHEQDPMLRDAALWLFDTSRTVVVTGMRVIGVREVQRGF